MLTLLNFRARLALQKRALCQQTGQTSGCNVSGLCRSCGFRATTLEIPDALTTSHTVLGTHEGVVGASVHVQLRLLLLLLLRRRRLRLRLRLCELLTAREGLLLRVKNVVSQGKKRAHHRHGRLTRISFPATNCSTRMLLCTIRISSLAFYSLAFYSWLMPRVITRLASAYDLRRTLA